MLLSFLSFSQNKVSRGSCSSGCTSISCVATADLVLLIWLPPLKSWDDRHLPPHPARILISKEHFCHMQRSKWNFGQADFLITPLSGNNNFHETVCENRQKQQSVTACESNVSTYFLEFLGRSENLLNNSTC